MNKPVGLDYILLVSIGVLWGAQFTLNELAIHDFSPLAIAAGRVLIGFVTLSVVVMLMPKSTPAQPDRADRDAGRQPWGLYCGIAVAEAILPCFLIPWGQQHVDSSIAAILIATVPLFVLVLAPLFVREERWSVIGAVSVLIGFAGVVVLLAPNITGSWLADVVGELAILGGALAYALSLIMMRHLAGVSPVLAMRNIFMIAAVPLVAATFVIDPLPSTTVDRTSILALLALGVFCGGFAYALFLYSVTRTGPTFTSLVGYLVTLFGVLFGIIFLGDMLQANDFIALGLIVAALTIARLGKR